MPVFEASESIVSTFPALILVLILVVLDSVFPISRTSVNTKGSGVAYQLVKQIIFFFIIIFPY